MTLTAGARLGPYEIVALIGVGGMGEVYRARDTRLQRDVAVKVLPESFAGDPDRLARFLREAQLLASLSHPNIGVIYGFEEADVGAGPPSPKASASRLGGALVLELVEGETLADRIARGPIALDEALPIATQIADALEAAHEAGVVHRDLKPANIKVTPNGRVKVLDFGLAKMREPAIAGPDVSHSPTITSPAMMTGVGVILGTAAYMSPEQARGRAVDKRADIWAFGCVLYEMLSGQRAFEGDDVTVTLARVVEREPDFDALPPSVPARVLQALRVCLRKDPKQRAGDIRDVRLALEGAFETTAPQGSAQAVVGDGLGRPGWRRVAMPAAGVVVVAVVAGTAVWVATRPAPPRVARTTITTSGGTALTMFAADRNLAVTPDGARIVYRGDGQILVRALDELEPTRVSGVGNARGLFVSPDGRWVGFFDPGTSMTSEPVGGTLRKVAITGGPPVTLANFVDGGFLRGATWGPDDTIIFATSTAVTGLQRVSAAGGDPTVLTRPNREDGESDHFWPEFLPGGRAVLFTITAVTGGLDAARVAVLDLQTGVHKVLVRGGSHAQYVSSGHLVYAAAGTLRAVPFDLARLQTRGTPVPVISEVAMTNDGGVNAVVARDGTLAYIQPGTGPVVALTSTAGGAVSGAQRTLAWVDRQGRETPIQAPPHTYNQPRLSPDGMRLAVQSDDEERDIWLWDLDRTTLTRVTLDRGIDIYPVWTPDSRRLIFGSTRGGNARNMFWQPADGTGPVDRLTESPNTQAPTAVTPDGGLLIFTEVAQKTGDDVMQVTLDEMRRVTPLVQSPFIERNGIVSPDGRWLAYEANDSGQLEIYVRPFPDVNGGRWQVSTAGGTRPLWARSGRELVYVSPAGALMRGGVEPAQSWAATTPTMVVKEGYFTNPGLAGRMYDIAPDGQRFLMIKNPIGGEMETAAPANLIVVQNWHEELKRLVPTN